MVDQWGTYMVTLWTNQISKIEKHVIETLQRVKPVLVWWGMVNGRLMSYHNGNHLDQSDFEYRKTLNLKESLITEIMCCDMFNGRK
jgi:hypothetical protein